MDTGIEQASEARVSEKIEAALARRETWKLGLRTDFSRDQISIFAETPLVSPRVAALLRDPDTKKVFLRAMRGEWSPSRSE